MWLSLKVSPTYPQPYSINDIDDNRLKASLLGGKNHEAFVVAVIAFHTGKTVLQIAAIEIWNHTNISGAFLSWNVVLNHRAICFISGSSMTRASIGQLFTQAQQ